MSKVTEKYQITIPPAVRNKLGIVPGSEVEIVKKGNEFVLIVNPIDLLKKAWRGKFKGTETTDEYMNVVRGETTAQIRAEMLAQASEKVREESMRINAEFDAIEEDLEA